MTPKDWNSGLVLAAITKLIRGFLTALLFPFESFKPN